MLLMQKLREKFNYILSHKAMDQLKNPLFHGLLVGGIYGVLSGFWPLALGIMFASGALSASLQYLLKRFDDKAFAVFENQRLIDPKKIAAFTTGMDSFTWKNWFRNLTNLNATWHYSSYRAGIRRAQMVQQALSTNKQDLKSRWYDSKIFDYLDENFSEHVLNKLYNLIGRNDLIQARLMKLCLTKFDDKQTVKLVPFIKKYAKVLNFNVKIPTGPYKDKSIFYVILETAFANNDTLLFTLLKNVDIATLDINIKIDKRNTLLHWVILSDKKLWATSSNNALSALEIISNGKIIKGCNNILQELLAKGADKEALYFGKTPLHLAISLKSQEMAATLIKSNVNLEANREMEVGFTPLHAAIDLGLNETALMLIKHADINVRHDGLAPLDFSILLHNKEIALALIAQKALLNLETGEAGNTPLHATIDDSEIKIDESLLQKKAEIALALIEAGADKEILYQGQTPLLRAIFHGRVEIAKKLIDSNANIHTPYSMKVGLTPLRIAIEKNQTEIALKLIEKGAKTEISCDGFTPLHASISFKNVKIATALLQQGANKEAILGQQGRTPLHHAIEQNQTEIAKVLVAFGVNIEVLYRDDTPLHRAISSSRVDIAKVLIDAGANKETRDSQGRTALQRAIIQGKNDIAIMLINANANIEAVFQEETALHLAITHRNKEVAKALIEAGAKLDVVFGNFTPLTRAVHDNLPQVVTLLLAKGVNKSLPISELRYLKDQSLIENLFADSLVYGYPLSTLLKDAAIFTTHFASIEQKFGLICDSSPIQFLYDNNLLDECKSEAIYLLHTIEANVKRYEANLNQGGGGTEYTSKFARANSHFNNTIVPQFQEAVLAYSQIKDEKEAINKIHECIRNTLLDAMLVQAQRKGASQMNVINFINAHREKLLLMDEEIMQASSEVFTSIEVLDTAQSAWRGFNKHAKVIINGWTNLLIPPLNPDSEVSHSGGLKAAVVYDDIYRRLAYYYVVVMDKNDGSDENRATRLENFILKLAEIRDAHGPNNPSCYPRVITRIADMGSFHEKAQLPPSLKDWIADFCKSKVLQAFNDQIRSLLTLQEKQDFFNAIIGISRHNAEAILRNTVTFSKDLLTIRNNFIKSLGGIQNYLEEVFIHPQNPGIVQEDIIYFEQGLLDVAGNDLVVAALADRMNREMDRAPTQEEINKINPFAIDSQPIEHDFFAVLLSSIQNKAPKCVASFRQLEAMQTYFKEKMPQLLQDKAQLKAILDVIDMQDIERLNLMQALNEILATKLWWQVIPERICNPFDNQVERLKKAKMPQTQIDRMIQKQTLFEKYVQQVQTAFQAKATKDFILHLTSSLVNHSFFNKGINLTTFKQEMKDEMTDLNQDEQRFLEQHWSLLLAFEEKSQLGVSYTPAFENKLTTPEQKSPIADAEEVGKQNDSKMLPAPM
ncbi:MAG: ankyrin repeat domain-containing protein [Proteobacteria bacterium]|nr:ankyrin repeat domain-containing protein [Pseudomonadota bacterium]